MRRRVKLLAFNSARSITVEPSSGLLASCREARAREAVRERDEIEEKLQKARAKKQREEARLQRQVELEEKRVERQRLKDVREQARAEKAAERARKVEAQHQTKSIQQAQ
ncbi:hypothetical protein PTT_10783 [Pyrenophora teres f. teres 0-1]|uniref:Uncharacterized protein n=2 Tax=Pyrenophora teres f. teres TaxID=97479 RepID=E3RQ24_PYRTT|nr:hypothetical protein PTT_10783 [Pyrenophora teres f. teres 0-1]